MEHLDTVLDKTYGHATESNTVSQQSTGPTVLDLWTRRQMLTWRLANQRKLFTCVHFPLCLTHTPPVRLSLSLSLSLSRFLSLSLALSLFLSHSLTLSLAGPINTLWMEHLITVLDETNMLTIISLSLYLALSPSLSLSLSLPCSRSLALSLSLSHRANQHVVDGAPEHGIGRDQDADPLSLSMSLADSLSLSLALSLTGPINTLWMEHLNTVLDETKMLTIANGDRMPLAEGNKVCITIRRIPLNTSANQGSEKGNLVLICVPYSRCWTKMLTIANCDRLPLAEGNKVCRV